MFCVRMFASWSRTGRRISQGGRLPNRCRPGAQLQGQPTWMPSTTSDAGWPGYYWDWFGQVLPFPGCLPKRLLENTCPLQAFQQWYSAVLPLSTDATNSKNDSYRITGSFPNDCCFRNGWLQSAAGQDPYPAESPTKTGTVFVFLQQVICDFVGLVDDTRV